MARSILRSASKNNLLIHTLTEKVAAPVILGTSTLIHQQLQLRYVNYLPKFKKERAKKVLKVKLLDFEEQRRDDQLSLEEMRARLKEKGLSPFRTWNEKPMFVSCSGLLFDEYVPPEGDGKISLVSTPGMKQTYETFGKKGRSYLALRKIRNIDYEFDVPTVAMQAQEIYIEAQKALTAKDEDKLHDLVTEKAFPEMMENAAKKTIVWNFLQSLEPPRIVHIRCESGMSKDSLFAQITVRLHTQQMLAVYDRFGRLMHGSEDTVKDVLEYIVLEKLITMPYGAWRIHGKIIPDWLPPKDAVKKTYHHPDIDKEFPEPPPPTSEETPTEESKEASNLTPAVA